VVGIEPPFDADDEQERVALAQRGRAEQDERRQVDRGEEDPEPSDRAGS
jgi:hypothetical protein